MSRTWVLLRGLVREQGHWGIFLQRLSSAYPQDRILCLDLPGAGVHFRTPAPCSVAGMRQLLSDELAKHPLPAGPRVLLAVSLGAMVALDWVRHDPRAFSHVVLINSSVKGLSWPWQRLRPGALLGLLPALTLAGPARERQILSVVSNSPEHYDELSTEWNTIAQARPISVANTLRQLLAALRFRLPAEGIHHPQVLVLASTRDRMVSVSCSRALAHYLRAPLVEHPTAGHDLTTDGPDWVQRQVHAFLGPAGS